MILNHAHLLPVVVVMDIFFLQCSASSKENLEQIGSKYANHNTTTKTMETYPELKLLQTDHGLFFNRNITVTPNGTVYRIPTVFDELNFQCTSNLPIQWISSIAWNSLLVNKIEIEKNRFMENDGDPSSSSLFTSKIHFHFRSDENLLNLTCRNLCHLTTQPKDKTDVDHKNLCRNTSFVVNDQRLEEEGEGDVAFLPYIDAHIVDDHQMDKIPLSPGVNHRCSHILNIDLENGAYECLQKNGARVLESGSRIISCQNPDECRHLHVVDRDCGDNGTFNVIKNCVTDKCLTFKIPVTPFVILCGSGNYDIVARSFFQTTKDSRTKNLRRISVYEDWREVLKRDKHAIGGVQALQNSQQGVLLSSRTCQKWNGPRARSSDEKGILEACEGEKINFTCYGQLAFFTPKFRWILTYLGGSVEEIGYGDTESVEESYHISRSNKTIRFKPNVSLVTCAVPVWNSFSWENYTVTVRLTKPTKPTFEGRKDLVFHYVEEKSSRFTCKADSSSWPPATYTWTFMLHNSEEAQRVLNSNTSWYTIVDEQYQSEFYLNPNSFVWYSPFTISCKAGNLVGASFAKFIFNGTKEGQRRPKEKASSFESTTNWSAIGTFGAILLIFILILIFAFHKIRKQKNKLTQLEIDLFRKGNQNKMTRDGGPSVANRVAEDLPYDQKYEVSWEDFEIENSNLGSGAYGLVMKGRLKNQPVAAKTIRPNAEKFVLLSLLSELKIMMYLEEHPFIVKLVGSCTKFLEEGRPYIFVELCELGSLESYIRENKESLMTSESSDYVDVEPTNFYANEPLRINRKLIVWSAQIANGMEFLASKQVIHADLAIRNILLKTPFETKITDFGLSRQLANTDMYQKKTKTRLPWRSMAIESLRDRIFTTKSDVWSYGVTVWEIFSLGSIPFPGLTWTVEFVSSLEQGLRLSKPRIASDQIYNILMVCWAENPVLRPNFGQLKTYFETLVES